MRVAILMNVAAAYWGRFYRHHPDLERRSYAEQKRALDEDAYAQMGAWEEALPAAGAEVMAITPNIRPKQLAWAREIGAPSARERGLGAIATEQLRRWRPDVLIVDDHDLGHGWRVRIRERVPSIRKVLGFCCAPYASAGEFEGYDALVTCSAEFVEGFRRLGVRSYLVVHAFNPSVLERLGPVPEADLGLTFVGAVVRGSGYHEEREALLELLVRELPLEIFSPGALRSRPRDAMETTARSGLYVAARTLRAVGLSAAALDRLPGIRAAARWNGVPRSQINRVLRARMRPPVYGLEMFRTLARSKVTLNRHGSVAARDAANIRLFEATGAGTCLLTDWKSNLASLFAIDSEVVAYRTPEECVEKARWLLDHPHERAAIAQAGQARTLRAHTYAHRAPELVAALREELAR